MKKILLALFSCALFSCSGSDDNMSVNQPSENFFKVNNATYSVEHAYILAIKYSNGDFAGYNVILTNGEISTNTDMDGIESFSTSITHAASFVIRFDNPLSSIPNGTFNYDTNPSSGDLSSYGIVTDIVIKGGEIASSNIISNGSDLIGENGRIIIAENMEDTNINFNLLTTVGQIQGQFTGQIHTNF